MYVTVVLNPFLHVRIFRNFPFLHLTIRGFLSLWIVRLSEEVPAVPFPDAEGVLPDVELVDFLAVPDERVPAAVYPLAFPDGFVFLFLKVVQLLLAARFWAARHCVQWYSGLSDQ